MDMDFYQKKATDTAIYPIKYAIIYPALGVANEAGEVLGKIKKVLRDKDGNFTDADTRSAIAAEIGDVLWYLAVLADDLGLSLDTIAEDNIKKLLSRKERGKLGGNGDSR